jgi:outer membrane protein OmpA-like peptidoglycan-associated protein
VPAFACDQEARRLCSFLTTSPEKRAGADLADIGVRQAVASSLTFDGADALHLRIGDQLVRTKEVRKIIERGGAAGLAFALAGCGVLGAPGSATAPAAGHSVSISQDTLPSALVAVLGSPAPGAAISGLVNATARSSEELTVLQTGAPPKIILGSVSPPPATVVVPGKPAVPRGDQTSYQAALYANRLKHWREEVTAGRNAEAAQVRDALAAWLRGLNLPAKIGHLADSPGPAASLVTESAAAANALAGLAEQHGNIFGSRRVVLLYTEDLASRLPAGELAGDTVYVTTRSLPSAAAASAAQVNLLAAGAAQAAVIGPEVTGLQLAALVSAALGQGGIHESASAPVPFANESAALSPSADAQLTPLLPQLRQAGVTAVINGFASTPGSALANYALSYGRASMVASFFESHGIPGSALIIVGHGASDLVAAGSSGANRRVTVVIERPS